MSSGNAFEWNELIDLAHSIRNSAGLGSAEAINRSAISRAYYGAFCLARNKGVNEGWISINNTGRDHEIVKNYYKGSSNRTKMNIGVALERLHVYRKYADYDDLCCDSENKAQACINRAQTIRDQLKSLA